MNGYEDRPVQLTHEAYEMFQEKYADYSCKIEPGWVYCFAPERQWYDSVNWAAASGVAILLVIAALLIVSQARKARTH